MKNNCEHIQTIISSKHDNIFHECINNISDSAEGPPVSILFNLNNILNYQIKWLR